MESVAQTSARTRTLWRNTFFYVFSQGGAGLAGFFTSIILANYLGVEGYGAYVFVFSSTTLFTFAADLGLSFYAFREMSRDREWIRHHYIALLLLKLIAGLLLIGASILILPFIPLPGNAADFLPLGFGVLLLTSLNGAAYSVFRAYERGAFQATTILYNRLTILLLVILFLVPLYYEVRTIFVIMIIVGISTFIINQLLVYRLCPQAFNFSQIPLSRIRTLMRASAPFMLIMLGNQLYLHCDMSMLAFMRGAGEAGLYAIPARLITFGIMLPAAFVNALFPSLNRLERAQLRLAVTGALRMLLLLAFPLGVAGWLFADGFLAFFYTATYAPAAMSIKIISVTLALMSLNWLLGHILYARGNARTMLFVVASAVGLNVALNMLVIPHYGAAGAALATLVTEVFIMLIEGWLVLKIIHPLWSDIPVIRIMISTVGAGAVVLLIAGRVPFLGRVIVGGLIYGILGYFLKIIKPSSFFTIFRSKV